MEQSFLVVCPTCGHSGRTNRQPSDKGVWRCTQCDGTGVEAGERACHECGMLIPAKRLAAMPETSLCVSCAGHHAFSAATFSEPAGTRRDFLRDRQSWIR